MAHIALRFRVRASPGISIEDELQGFMLTLASIDGMEEADGELTFYVASGAWSVSHRHMLDAHLHDNPAIRFLGAETIEDRDWNAEWEASVKPEHVTESLVITPSWHREQAIAMGATRTIIIDPKMSFGTGHHETTRLCLRTLETLDCNGALVLDLGTGTGILAIDALLLGAHHATGVDTDRWSIENAEENRALNDLTSEQFEIRSGTLQTAVQHEERFDIILANIHRNVLLELAPELRKHIAPAGMLILSGLLVYDADEVEEAYRAVGFEFLRHETESEWACLIFKSPA